MAGIAYHPWYAVHGTKDFNDDKKWYETTVKVSSLYDCIVNVGTGNGRPDDKEANISYLSGQGGILCYSIPNANKPTYTHQEEVRRNLVDGYIENGVEIIYAEKMTFTSGNTEHRVLQDGAITYSSIKNSLTLENRYKCYAYSNLLECYVKVYIQWNESDDIYLSTINWNPNGSWSDHVFNGTYSHIIVIDKSPYLVTAKNMLHTDIIGDPLPYNSNDATYIANDGNADTDVTDMPTNTLVWDANTSTMWKTKVDTIDLTDSTPSIAIEEGDNWTEVKKGYPQELRSLLASGKGIGFCSSLLVGQDGSSYIDPFAESLKYSVDTNFTFMTLSKKVENMNMPIFYNDNNYIAYPNYHSSDSALLGVNIPGVNLPHNAFWFYNKNINNGSTLIVPSNCINQPAIQIQSPKSIKTVDKDLIATNSHSIYGYNGLNYAASGKIATGSSVESKSVDDVIFGGEIAYTYKSSDGIVPVEIGDTILVVKGCEGFAGYEGCVGCIYKRVQYAFSTYDLNDIYYNDPSNMVIVGFISTPTNSTVSLDNKSITASKALISQTENATQVFTQEISSGWDGTATFEDDVTTGLTIGTTYKEVTTGGLYVAEADKITVSDTATWSYPAAYNDSGTFKQLTTGMTTDNSMNTIQTKVLLKASSIKV